MKKYIRVCLSLDAETNKELEELAAGHGMTKSQYLKMLIHALYSGEKLPYFIQLMRK